MRELAGALHARGVRSGSTVGLLCRSHAGLVEAAFATLWIGAEPFLIRPDIDHEQLAGLARPDLLVHDAAMADVVRRAGLGVTTLVSDAHGSGSVTSVRSFGHPAPRPGRSAHSGSSSFDGTVLAGAVAQIGLGRPIVFSRG